MMYVLHKVIHTAYSFFIVAMYETNSRYVDTLRWNTRDLALLGLLYT